MAISLYDMVGNWTCSPPVIYQEIQKIMEDPDASFDDFGKIISSDPNLASQLLKLANSAYYNLSSQVDTISHALGVVGMEQLSDLVFSIVVINQFQGIPKSLLDIEDFWRHSIACAVAARNIAVAKDPGEEERYYLAGMLHDIGTLVVCKAQPQKAAEVLQKARDTGQDLCTLELESLGFDHTAMGSVLLKGWKLPENLIDAVAFHHQPGQAENAPKIAAAVHVADVLVHDLGLGNNGEPAVPKLHPAALKTLNLTRDFIEEQKQTILDQVEEVFTIFIR